MSVDLRQGDSRIVLADIVPDCLLTDPPYSEHVHKSATSCGTPGAKPSVCRRCAGYGMCSSGLDGDERLECPDCRGTGKGTLQGAAHRDLGFEHLGEDLMAWTCALAAKTRRWSVIFTDTESVGLWKAGLEAAGATYIRAVPWVRWSMPQLSGDRPPQGHEMVVLAWGSAKGKKSWNGPGNLTHFSHTCMRGKNKHKAQKPLDLMLDLVEFFSNASVATERNSVSSGQIYVDTVCDPFYGSGTTAMACAALGRNFIGCEQDATWHLSAARRLGLDPEIEQTPMYDDEERFSKYNAASTARRADMERMAKNTARIVTNRAAAAMIVQSPGEIFGTTEDEVPL